MPLIPTPGFSLGDEGLLYEIAPAGIYQGATLYFRKNLPLFPAQFWTLEYGLVPTSGKLSGPLTFQSVPLGDGGDIQVVDVPSTITKTWAPGNYTFQVYAQITAAGVTALGLPITTRKYLSTGSIRVFADLTSAGAVDTRGFYTRIVDELDAMILATAGDTQQKISIGRGTIAGQSIEGWNREQIIALRDYYFELAQNEIRVRNRRGGAPNPRIKYAFMGGGGGSYLGANGFPDQFPIA